ncbi:N-6 DNA methylase [Streptomyces rhizosphaericola]|uniref:SAM-dependent methyltransferase n=1 Tax=Streptomyces rhizosphaericola TaxID=2564098 RepID=A0ABY2PMM1_9ACTN|nr:N-6 DNA methylase [Streptomyces rhizosphaericola]TGZ12138.1 SAM-dependent methyltransferase [Streptomyces rhizosphaericola]
MPKQPDASAPPEASAQVTAADISRLAGVTRATVSNWRRRHADFPSPAGGTDSSPLYDLAQVRDWLARRGHGEKIPPLEELRTLLRLSAHPRETAARLLPFVLAERRRPDLFNAADALPDSDVAARAQALVRELPAPSEAHFDDVTYTAPDAPLLRAILHCIDAGQTQGAVDVLAERELEDETAGGTYTTPGPIAELMARLLATASSPSRYPIRVFDPACGSGALLVAAARQGARHLYGQDLVPVQARRTLIHLGIEAPDASADIRAEDSLRADAFADLTADGALCNPPYGDRDWGHDELAYDPRWAYGVPPRGDSELAWVQHVLAHVTPGGFAVVLLTPATASRSLSRRIRAELIRTGALRAVISLPAGVAPPLHIGLHVWVLQRPELTAPEHHSVLCVDGVALAGGDGKTAARLTRTGASGGVPRRDGAAAAAWEALSEGVLNYWTSYVTDPAAFKDVPGQARAVPVVDLLDDLVDVTPARNIRTAAVVAAPAAVAEQAARLGRELAQAARGLAAETRAQEWPASGAEARQWRTATLADLTRGGALTLHRVGPPSTRERDTPPPAEFANRPVLGGRDVVAGQRATADPQTPVPNATVIVAEGDVLLAEIRSAHGTTARVADEQDSGAVIGRGVRLIRPDPKRLDAWFLAGFLAAEDNLNSASVGTSSLQIDPSRLRVPLLPLEEQRRYGEAFRHLHGLRQAARQVTELAVLLPKTLAEGLTSGTLVPPESGDSERAAPARSSR